MCYGNQLVVYRFIIRLPFPRGTPAHERQLPPTYDPHTKWTSLFETVDMGGGYLHNPSWENWTKPRSTPAPGSGRTAEDKYTDPWDIWCDVNFDITKVQVHTGYQGAGPWMLNYRKHSSSSKGDTTVNKTRARRPRRSSLSTISSLNESERADSTKAPRERRSNSNTRNAPAISVQGFAITNEQPSKKDGKGKSRWRKPWKRN